MPEQGRAAELRKQIASFVTEFAYLLTPCGIEQKAVITVDFLRRKVDEYESAKVKIRPLPLYVGQSSPSSGKP